MNTLPAMNRRPIGLKNQQRGATLIVGLVLMLVLTVVGVSGMQTSTMEVNMAANTQFQQDAFQMTEDAIDIEIGTLDYSTDAPHILPWTTNPDYDRRAVTTYRFNTNIPSDAVFSYTEFDAFHFDIQSVGKGPRNATSQHIQSFYVIGRAL